MILDKLIPNFFTLLNLLCGCLAIVSAGESYYSLSLNFVLIAAFFDFIDGMSARLLNAKSDFGKQLDSLSDIVSFGVAPSFIIFHFMSDNKSLLPDTILNDILPYFAFLIALFSAIRLAVFNILTHQDDYFSGLPTPANGLFFASIPMFCYSSFEIIDISSQFRGFVDNNVVMIIIIVIFSYLLVSKIKLFSLKFKNLVWLENRGKYVFVSLSLVFFILFFLQSIPLIILLYLGISVICNLITEKN
jgi:CDP-diacylglycerol--serine O-phosphatidyltransferase